MFYTDEDKPRCKVQIGRRYRDSRITADNTTPRTMSRDVLDQGSHADTIQSVLLGDWMRDREDRIVWRATLVMAVIGIMWWLR